MKTCELCHAAFLPHRSDAAFCSSRCRQKAYLNRKIPVTATSGKTDTALSNVLVEENPALPLVMLQTPPTPQNASPGTPVTGKGIQSHFLDHSQLLMDIRGREEYLIARYSKGFTEYEIYVYVRYRCFCDYLLAFSEQAFVYKAHLKDLYNAFKSVSDSIEFIGFEAYSPYLNEFTAWINRLRECILNTPHTAKMVFRLDMDLRTELLCTRFELARFFEKRRFSDFEFITPQDLKAEERKQKKIWEQEREEKRKEVPGYTKQCYLSPGFSQFRNAKKKRG